MMPKSASQLKIPSGEKEIVPFFRQMLCSLHAMHSIGIWHEDLKPANILISEQGTPVLADFGLTTFSPVMKKISGGGGTLDFMSPEKIEVRLVWYQFDMHVAEPGSIQSLQNYPYNGAAADVYACGILLYKWLMNHHPYIRNRHDDTDEQIEERVLNSDMDFRMDVSPGSAGELIRKMIRSDPHRRWTVRSLWRELADQVEGSGTDGS